MRGLVLIAALIVACQSPLTVATPVPSTPNPSATVTATPTPVAIASPAPAATPATTGLGTLVRGLAPSWRPSGVTVVVGEALDLVKERLIAVPLGGERPVPLLEFSGSEWDVSRAGDVVLSVQDGQAPRRLALWRSATGAVSWLSAAEPSSHDSPVWSADGTQVYFAAHEGGTTPTATIVRVDARDGRREVVKRVTASPLGIYLRGLTPDGAGLYWGRIGLEGTTLDILDLVTGAERAFVAAPPVAIGPAFVASWRSARPRALVVRHGGNPPDSSLLIWDDVAATISRVLLGPNEQLGGAAWSPDGARLVASRAFPGSARYRLTVLGADGSGSADIGGSDGATDPLWLVPGIVYLFRPAAAANTASELRLISVAGGTPTTLLAATTGVGFRRMRSL